MRHPGTYIMRDQVRDRVAVLMQEDVRGSKEPAADLWSPALLFAGILLANVLLAGMTA